MYRISITRRIDKVRERQKMPRIVIITTLIIVLFACISYSESINTKQVPNSTLILLKEDFLMGDVLNLLKNARNHDRVKTYLSVKSGRYKHSVTMPQGEMIVEGYTILDLTSPIIGYTLFFYGSSGALINIDTSVNPLNDDAMESIVHLTNIAFDSVKAGDNSKLHFLGILDLDDNSLLKIMVFEAKTTLGKEYAIRYGISIK